MNYRVMISRRHYKKRRNSHVVFELVDEFGVPHLPVNEVSDPIRLFVNCVLQLLIRPGVVGGHYLTILPTSLSVCGGRLYLGDNYEAAEFKSL